MIRMRMDRFKKIVFVSLLLSLLIFPNSCSGDPQATKAKHLEKGNSYLGSSNYNEAIIEFKSAIQIDPKDAQAHYKLGLIYFNLGGLPNLQEAFKELTRSTELDPNNMDAQVKLGETLLDFTIVRKGSRESRPCFKEGT